METVVIGGKICRILQNGVGGPALFWGISDRDRDHLETMAALVSQFAQRSRFLLAAYEVENWDRDLTPWEAPKAFGRGGYGGCAEQTLDWLLHACVPYVEANYGAGRPHLLGGYSLAGLFSLWAFYESGAFQGAASCSGSLWFPGWDDFARNRTAPENSLLYLSLGDKEERTKNQTLASVGDAVRKQYELACRDSHILRCTLEWNAGGHFRDPELRLAKGFGWLLENLNVMHD